ncbi:MAG: hypothetical protein IPJ65_34490 [Archangiaceae bacterium]|nr:hypothetical protein [Archangiaceae bacterium]
MATVRTLLAWIFGGALLGLLVASLIAPKYLGWYNAPGLGQALCDCVKMTDEITAKLLALQVEGAAGGAVLFLIAGIVLEVRRRKKQPPASTAMA